MQTTNAKKWAVPLFCLFLGIAFLVVFWIAGNPGAGVGPLVIMVGYGALLLFGGRSEIIKVLRDQPSDERYRMFNLRASVFSYCLVIALVLGGFFYEIARGQDGSPYSLIGAVGGIGYIAALLVLRWRA
jgi:hypothetical protein